MYYKRLISPEILKQCFKKKVIILYGARQVGKTTLVQSLAKELGVEYRYLNADEEDVRQGMNTESSLSLQRFLGTYPLIIIDEAQRIPNIGLKLKLLHDNNPDQQIIATGSSSFELANKINEPLTGRVVTYTLFPLSLQEIRLPHEFLLAPAQLQRILRFGSYPDIVDRNDKESQLYLKELTENYLYKDILTFDTIHKSSVVHKLVQLLAYQVGQEVSLNELANTLNVHVVTVDKYISLLEKMFVVFRLPAWSKNHRNEIGKKEKIYFRDLGIRNTVIDSFMPIDTRPDIGALRENYCIAERKKHLAYTQSVIQSYFRRSYTQQEVDYVESHGEGLQGYEIKRNPNKKVKVPSQFITNYPNASFQIINPDNYDNLTNHSTT